MGRRRNGREDVCRTQGRSRCLSGRRYSWGREDECEHLECAHSVRFIPVPHLHLVALSRERRSLSNAGCQSLLIGYMFTATLLLSAGFTTDASSSLKLKSVAASPVMSRAPRLKVRSCIAH